MQNRFTGRQVVGIMGAAQIDIYGNLNSTVIGDYHKPTVRFSGSGGACDVASFVSRTIIFMQHAKRKFVPKLDYLTSPGWLDGPDGRRKAGLPDGGPACVITNMAIMGFDPESKQMVLKGVSRASAKRRFSTTWALPLMSHRLSRSHLPRRKNWPFYGRSAILLGQ
jgi:glutaconate CoA-transferase subunit B